MKDIFQNPPINYSTRPFWELGGANEHKVSLTREALITQMEQEKLSARYGGFTVLPVAETCPVFPSSEFFERYKDILEKAKAGGVHITLYDEVDFPSGRYNGKLKELYPHLVAKRLDCFVYEGDINVGLPKGELMAAVAVLKNKKRVNIKTYIQDNVLKYSAPKGVRAMLFMLVEDENCKTLDYLSEKKVKEFISLTYDEYYKHFSPYFGNVIDMAFFDDLSFYYVEGNRAWTEDFNESFKKEYGEEPDLLYPAMWEDIGDETHVARFRLFSHRAQMFSLAYPKIVGDWCREHNIKSSGHPASPLALVPTALCGDFMKMYKHVDIPLLDEILYFGYARQAYKIASSAAYNYDKELAACETFGAMHEHGIVGLNRLNIPMMYQTVMEQYVRGINFLVPHATWYDSEHYRIPPLLSYKSPQYGPELGIFNEYVSRLNVLLTGGRHICDIAVLYPIDAINSEYNVSYGEREMQKGVMGFDCGGVTRADWPWLDYMELGEILCNEVRRDFTFIHPEVLDEQVLLEKNKLHLENDINFEDYSIFIIPGCKRIRLSNLKKLKMFYDKGGVVIATSQLPISAVEKGKDKEVIKIIKHMFNVDPTTNRVIRSTYTENENENGGRAYFIATGEGDLSEPRPRLLNSNLIEHVLNDALKIADVKIEGASTPLIGGTLSYIHRFNEGKDIYFFANSSESPVDFWASLKGEIKPMIWDPLTGAIDEIEAVFDGDVTKIHLYLNAVNSIFIVDGKIESKKILFYDDFINNHHKWEKMSCEMIINNEASLPMLKLYSPFVAAKAGESWQNYSFSVSTSFSGGYAGVAIRAQDENNGYLIKLYDGGVKLFKKINGKETLLVKSSMNLISGVVYRIRAEIKDNEIAVFLGATEAARICDNSFKKGKIALLGSGFAKFCHASVVEL